MNYLLVECSLPDRPFAIRASPRVLRVTCQSIMWQKERLLNLAIANLPGSCSKVVWMDADILFSNPEWTVKTSELLDSHPVVQPFDTVALLPPKTQVFTGVGDVHRSFAFVHLADPGIFLSGNFRAHGHTGFAWAARKQILKSFLLYDRSISGGGDHLMAHGFCGDSGSPCVRYMVGTGTQFSDSFRTWVSSAYGEVRSNIGCASGTVLHLWHGERANRLYDLRCRELLRLGYDPTRDICIGPHGTWEWTSQKSNLHTWAEQYFKLRREDTFCP